jgi:hypothetical protein
MNKKQFLAGSIGVLSLIAGIFAVRLFWTEAPTDLPVEVHDLTGWDHKVSGPYTHKNLTVFLIHGDDRLAGKTPLTLEEALKSKLAIVHETRDVNELEIENISKTDEIYVQAGDIVKGGKQDRVLAVDLIVPARSERVALDAFCVEQGRWAQRKTESATAFNSSSDAAPSKDLKMAARVSKSQGEVWAKVAESQDKLSASANTSVRSSESRSSLQLSVENPAVRSNSNEYVNALSSIVSGHNDVVGFVFAINGEINSADIYGSGALFIKLWPKLLKATAIEAVSESTERSSGSHVGADALVAFFIEAEAGPVILTRSVTKRISMITHESTKSVFLETRDSNQNGAWIHRNYMTK